MAGVKTLLGAFPKVHVLTTAIDERIDELFHIRPGVGNFGDRYFGTGTVSKPVTSSVPTH
jgi:uracil phosphoribosyltransferase